MRRRVRADRRIVGAGRWRLFVMLLLGCLTMPAAAALPTDVVPPPPAQQFREGDHWRSWGVDASGRPTNSFRFFGVRGGAWYELPNDLDDYSGARDARSFEQLKDPVFYPAAPYDKQIVATADGLLHRYVDGQWTDLPLGSTLTDQRGTVYRIDVRATAYDADQLSQVFQHAALTEQPTGESKTSAILLPPPDQLVAASDPSVEQKPAEAPASEPAKPPVSTPAAAPEAAPASSGVSLKMAALYLLLGGILALVLVKLLGRKPPPPSA